VERREVGGREGARWSTRTRGAPPPGGPPVQVDPGVPIRYVLSPSRSLEPAGRSSWSACRAQALWGTAPRGRALSSCARRENAREAGDPGDADPRRRGKLRCFDQRLRGRDRAHGREAPNCVMAGRANCVDVARLERTLAKVHGDGGAGDRRLVRRRRARGGQIVGSLRRTGRGVDRRGRAAPPAGSSLDPVLAGLHPSRARPRSDCSP